MTPTELVLSRLGNPKPQGRGWMAHCPAHNDGHPSLSIGEGDDGRALLYCQAGCELRAVTEAMGLKVVDLMPPRDDPPRERPPASKPMGGTQSHTVYHDAAHAVAELERRHGKHSTIWRYRDANGEPLGAVVRFNTPQGKIIRPICKVAGGWVIGGMPEPRPLYGLPELVAKPSECVFICEGEKACDAMARVGYLATTSPQGAKSAAKAEWTPLSGRDVIVFPDHDEAGEQYASTVTAILGALSPPASVRIVRLSDAWPDLPRGGDMADLVERTEGNAGAMSDLRRSIDALIGTAHPGPCSASVPAVLPFQPFPLDALPEPVRRFVSELAAATANDPACAGLAALVVLAGTVGNRAVVHLKKGWTEPAILWGAIVARSGTTKSAVLKLATRAHVEIHKALRQEHSYALQTYRMETDAYEEKLDCWRKSQKAGKGSELPPQEPHPPNEKRLIVSDVTCEKLACLLQDNPMGLLLIRDELAAWIGSFDRYASGGKGSDAPTWLSFFDGASVPIDRKSAGGSVFVERATVSVLGSIQPGTLRRLFGARERESGLLARILLAQPPVRPMVWTDAELSDEAADQWKELIEGIIGIEPATDVHGNPRPHIVLFSLDARREFIEWHDRHGAEVAKVESDDLAAHMTKLKGICARLALIFACVQSVATSGPMTEITSDQMQRAIAVTEWLKHEARRVYGVLGESSDEHDLRIVVEFMRRRRGCVTARELQQGVRAMRRPGVAERALLELVDAGVARVELASPGKKGGRPSRVFRLIEPSAAAIPSTAPTKPLAVQSKEGSVDVGAVDGVCIENGEWGEV